MRKPPKGAARCRTPTAARCRLPWTPGSPSLLTFTSVQAPSADPFCHAVALAIGQIAGIPATFVGDLPWQERARRFDAGAIDVCWMCGWPYAERADRPQASLALLAAPVMADPRYGDRPIYFSDIVVRADSPFRTFVDLRGRSWAYNEPHSHSGYNAVRHFLATQNLDAGFFASVVESGSHAASAGLIISGAIDASAIDSTVLASLMDGRPELAATLRVIGTIGPSPAPPWIARGSLPAALRDSVRTAFLHLHEHDEGRKVLASGGVKRFAAVADADYDPIRAMAAAGSATRL